MSATHHLLHHRDINTLYMALLETLLREGEYADPRKQKTYEIVPMTLILEDSLQNIITIPERNLNYSFMVAEWFWIMGARRDVASIAPYNKRIAEFSDDGVTYFGAYGPKIDAQRHYVISKLHNDPQSRQAVINIWRESPTQTRDVPCTVAMQFMIRNDKLLCNVFMRSSDAWLGVPYDLFNFSRIQAVIAADLEIEPGALSVTLGSSHIYEQHFNAAEDLLIANKHTVPKSGVSPVLRGHFGASFFRDLEEAVRAHPVTYGAALDESMHTFIDRDPIWYDYAEAMSYRFTKDIDHTGHIMDVVRTVASWNKKSQPSHRGKED